MTGQAEAVARSPASWLREGRNSSTRQQRALRPARPPRSPQPALAVAVQTGGTLPWAAPLLPGGRSAPQSRDLAVPVRGGVGRWSLSPCRPLSCPPLLFAPRSTSSTSCLASKRLPCLMTQRRLPQLCSQRGPFPRLSLFCTREDPAQRSLPQRPPYAPPSQQGTLLPSALQPGACRQTKRPIPRVPRTLASPLAPHFPRC